MFPFYPFINEEKQNEELQQIPLYIEEIYYPINKEEIEQETENIIILNLF